MSLAAVIDNLGVSQRELARDAQLSKSAVSRIVKGEWPARGATQARARLQDCLKARGATATQLLALFAAPVEKKLAPASSQLAEAVPPRSPR